jgi:archaellum biogenesis ATPase FlaH
VTEPGPAEPASSPADPADDLRPDDVVLEAPTAERVSGPWSAGELGAIEQLAEAAHETGGQPAEAALARLEQELAVVAAAGQRRVTEVEALRPVLALAADLAKRDRGGVEDLRALIADARKALEIPTPPARSLAMAHACAFRDAKPATFLSTDLETIDRFTLGGLWCERLIVIAGEPNVGKTALAMQLAGVACESKSAVLVHAADVDKRADIAARIGVARGVSRDALRRCSSEAQEKTAAIMAKWALKIADQFADDYTIEDSVEALLELGRRTGARSLVLVVDSLQTAICRALLGPSAPRFDKDRIEATCRALLTATRRGITVIATSEVPRNFYSNKALDQPSDMAAVKGSGRVEFALWTLLVLRRLRGSTPNAFHLGMPKNKGGQPEGALELRYTAELGTFTDAGEVPYESKAKGGERKKPEDQGTFDAKIETEARKLVPHLARKLAAAGSKGLSARQIRGALVGRNPAKDRAADLAVEDELAVARVVKGGHDRYFAPSTAPAEAPPDSES